MSPDDLKKDGGTVYPFREDGPGQSPGMRLRDHFAIESMKAIRISDNGNAFGPWTTSSDAVAAKAYEDADAMLRARALHPHAGDTSTNESETK